jgi:hypothetical protein
MGHTLYVHPKPEELSEIVLALLNGTPAICTKIKMTKGKHRRRNVVNAPIDFRHILFAGWIAIYHDARDKEELSLFKINRLCDRSILHQDALKTWTEHFEKKLSAPNVSN